MCSRSYSMIVFVVIQSYHDANWNSNLNVKEICMLFGCTQFLIRNNYNIEIHYITLLLTLKKNMKVFDSDIWKSRSRGLIAVCYDESVLTTFAIWNFDNFVHNFLQSMNNDLTLNFEKYIQYLFKQFLVSFRNILNEFLLLLSVPTLYLRNVWSKTDPINQKIHCIHTWLNMMNFPSWFWHV